MINVRTAKGPTILLGSGTYHDFDDPESTQLTIEDYAYSLAFECRFRGQCVSRRTEKRVFYSVAQHAVLCSQQTPTGIGWDGAEDAKRQLAFELLMHESGETVCGDMTSPLKMKIPEFKAVEKVQESAINKRFGVDFRNPRLVKHVDLRMWATERRDLMRWDGKPWGGDGFGDPNGGIKPYDFEVVPVGPYEAADMFIDRWKELGGVEAFNRASGETPVFEEQRYAPETKAGMGRAADIVDNYWKGVPANRWRKRHATAQDFANLIRGAAV